MSFIEKKKKRNYNDNNKNRYILVCNYFAGSDPKYYWAGDTLHYFFKAFNLALKFFIQNID